MQPARVHECMLLCLPGEERWLISRTAAGKAMGNATHQFGSGIATLFTSLLMYTFLFFSINTDQQGISSDRVNTRVNFVLIK